MLLAPPPTPQASPAELRRCSVLFAPSVDNLTVLLLAKSSPSPAVRSISRTCRSMRSISRSLALCAMFGTESRPYLRVQVHCYARRASRVRKRVPQSRSPRLIVQCLIHTWCGIDCCGAVERQRLYVYHVAMSSSMLFNCASHRDSNNFLDVSKAWRVGIKLSCSTPSPPTPASKTRGPSPSTNSDCVSCAIPLRPTARNSRSE